MYELREGSLVGHYRVVDRVDFGDLCIASIIYLQGYVGNEMFSVRSSSVPAALLGEFCNWHSKDEMIDLMDEWLVNHSGIGSPLSPNINPNTIADPSQLWLDEELPNPTPPYFPRAQERCKCDIKDLLSVGHKPNCPEKK